MERLKSDIPGQEVISRSNVATAMVKALKAAGVDTILGQCCPIALFVAAENEGIRQIGYRTENAGAVMADGCARVQGRVAVIACQNGPAAALLVAGLCESLKASVPVLAIVQDVARSGLDRNAFQELDHEAMFRPCAKWVRRIPTGQRASEYIRRGIRAATTGRPGPAVLIVPFDMVTEEIDTVEPPADITPAMAEVPADRFMPSRAAMETAIRTMMTAKRPLVVAGGGVHVSGACDALARLQHRWQVPVSTTNMGKGTVDEAHPLTIGVIGYVMGSRSPTRFLKEYVQRADAVLFVGTRTNENGTASWTLFDKDAAFMHIDVDPDEIGRNYSCQRLLGDARETLDMLLEESIRLGVGPHPSGPAVQDQIGAARAAHQVELLPFVSGKAAKLRPELLMRALSSLASPDTIWVADASYSSLWVAQYVQARRAGQRFVTPRGLGGLGWGLPLAVGAKLGHPSATVIAVVGDGGFAHCWSELETAKRHGLPVIVLVLNNGVLGFQRDAEIKRFGNFANICAIGPFDHVAIARACGCDGIALHEARDIAAVFEQALASPVPFVIDAFVDPEAFPPITAFETLSGGVSSEAGPAH